MQVHAYDAHNEAPEFDDFPMLGMALDYTDQYHVPPHQHQKAQLLYALRGVMVVGSEQGQWVVPPSRGLWLPAGCRHWIRMVGEVKVRTVFMPARYNALLPQSCCVLNISALLRELILATQAIPQDYTQDSRAARLVQVLIDELQPAEILPVHLPLSQHARVQQICQDILDNPDQCNTARQWGAQLHVHPKTIQRQFVQETGMTLGQWQQQAKLLMAMEMLASGRRVLDVALALGYNSPSAFSTMFKRQLGILPGVFAVDQQA